jgi:hypothetical protein
VRTTSGAARPPSSWGSRRAPRSAPSSSRCSRTSAPSVTRRWPLALGGDAASTEALAAALAADGALSTEIHTRLTELEHEVVPELVIPRVLHGVRLREHALGLFLDRYTQALRASEGGPASPSARALRRQLELQLGADDAETRRGAAEAIAGLGARGVLLALRQSGRAGTAEADLVLSPSGRR